VSRRRLGAVALAGSVTVLMAIGYFWLSHKGRLPSGISELCYWVWDTWAFLPIAMVLLIAGRLVWPKSRKPA
jgi:hypothetical protein